MKKLQFFLMIGALSMLMASCMKEDDEQKTLKSYGTFQVNPPAFSTDSKAFLHFTQTLSRILYQEGDIIYINGVPFALSKSGQGESTVWYANRADGSHDDISDYTFYCCYADGSVTNFDSPNYTVSMEDNSASTTGIVLAGSTESNVITLTPCFAALVFESSDVTYTSVKVGFSSDVVPTKFDVSATSDPEISMQTGYSTLETPSQGSNNYLMNMHDTTINSRRYFWVAVPIIGSEISTFLYISYTKNGNTEYRRTKTMVTLEPGKVYKLPSEDMSQYAFNSDGVGNGKFSISATQKVSFSAGNLQCSPGSNTWRFAEYQYEMITEANNINVRNNSTFYVDLFGWATSGWNNGNGINNSWNPAYTNAIASNYGPSGSDLIGNYANSDWGVYNSTSIKYGNAMSSVSWRTLSQSEWNYLLSGRTGATSKRGRATIDGQYAGVVLLPDEWTLPTGLSFLSGGNSFTRNEYTLEQWDKMEKAGAIFLPAAGYRFKDNSSNIISGKGSNGYYWTVTHSGTNQACVFSFDNAAYRTGSTNVNDRNYGCSVRLVTDVQ